MATVRAQAERLLLFFPKQKPQSGRDPQVSLARNLCRNEEVFRLNNSVRKRITDLVMADPVIDTAAN